ncbi:MAG: mucoidy inhibitor MuiA family protein, partial [Bacteroidota bacterium]|nr:mucoidy inhibitor MuiA family protein [Bacteroidota bacterium]
MTVYQSGAMVNRGARVALSSGTQEIIFTGLSTLIDPNTIEVEGSGNVTILSVIYNINYLKEQEKSPELAGLESALDSAEMKLEMLRNEHFALDEEIRLLQENRKMTPSEKSIFIEDLEDLADFYSSRIQEVRNRTLHVTDLEKKAAYRVSQLRQQLEVYKALNKTPSGEVIVTMAVPAYVSSEMMLRYYVNNAGWTPTYSLRAQQVNEPVRLDYDAMVYQLTGEDWKNVKLTLSTGNPALGGQKPTLATWLVGVPDYTNRTYGYTEKSATYYSPPPVSAYDSTVTVGANYAADFTTVSNNLLNAIFEVSLPYDIPSNGQPRQVRI